MSCVIEQEINDHTSNSLIQQYINISMCHEKTAMSSVKQKGSNEHHYCNKAVMTLAPGCWRDVGINYLCMLDKLTISYACYELERVIWVIGVH